MILHKLLRGAGAEKYLPFALSRLRWLEKIFSAKGFFQQQFEIESFTVDVQQAPPFQYIRIIGGPSVFYEMFTPDHVSDTTLASPGHEGGFLHSFVCGTASRTRFSDGKSRSAGLSSSTIAPGGNDDWIARDCESLDMGTLGFWTMHAWQNQKFFEHCWHPNNDGKSLVTSCQAQAPGLAGQCGWMSAYVYRRIASTGSIASDFTLDVHPTYYEKDTVFSGAPVFAEPWIWYRRAAVHTASDGRKFFVHTDNYGRFQIYPVKSYDEDENLVHTYWLETPPYPGWVTLPNPADQYAIVNDWLWRFNKDATKCVSVPYHSTFGGGFSKYLDGTAYFATLTAATVARIHPDYAFHVTPAREDTPGLVEFGLEIEITGPNEFDFIPHFTLLRNEYFDVKQRFFFEAAYTLPDTEHDPDTDPRFVPEDTLVTAEIECTYAAGYYTPASADGLYLDAAGNVKGDVVINLNDEDLLPSREVHRTPALPGGCQQFLTPAGYDSDYAPNGPIGSYLPFAHAITGDLVMAFVPSGGPVIYHPPPPFPPIDVSVGGSWAMHSYQLSLLYALELSTLSWNYEFQDTIAGTYSKRVFVYGDAVFDETFPFTEPEAPLGWPASDTKMPSVRWYQWLLNATINTEWGSGFSVHPHGHWAHSVNAEQGGTIGAPGDPAWAPDLDLISVKELPENGGGRSQFTHKDLFNDAFNQNRDYTFYTEPYPGKTFWDMGSFRSAGIWVTYRDS